MPYIATVGMVPIYLIGKLSRGESVVLEEAAGEEHALFIEGTQIIVDKEIMEAADPPWEFTWVKNHDPLSIAMTKLMHRVNRDASANSEKRHLTQPEKGKS